MVRVRHRQGWRGRLGQITPMSTPKKRKYFTIRKFQGDDLYSWAVFRKGTSEPVCTGCGRSEAGYHADQLEKMEQEKKVQSFVDSNHLKLR